MLNAYADQVQIVWLKKIVNGKKIRKFRNMIRLNTVNAIIKITNALVAPPELMTGTVFT